MQCPSGIGQKWAALGTQLLANDGKALSSTMLDPVLSVGVCGQATFDHHTTMTMSI
jgi:hypothetical protein